MSFVYQQYIIGIILFILIFAFILIKQENKFFEFVERFWFKKRSYLYLISRAFFLLGISLLALSLLDLRGPEERIKTKVPSKRTIVLIDTSASMLAEDVRPSRLEKAVLLAKHFARKAVGHQISVIAFSEIQKKIVPFTADIDLIDSRLESIRGLKNQYGTSALSMAIQEAILSFSSAGEGEKGNILVLTDGEETADGIELKIPEGVYIAFVGIGTKNGGRIPLDDKRGMRYGYKQYKGKEVITKLNEDFFTSIVNKYPQTRFWTADTYSLPSEEIVSFFDAEFSKGIENQDMVIRPVFMHWLVAPGVIFLVISYLLKMTKVFAILAILIINPLGAQEHEGIVEKEIPQHIVEGLEKLKEGRLTSQQKIGLAYELQKNDLPKEALTLYKENLENLTPEQRFNYGTAMLQNKDYAAGFSEYQKLFEQENISEDLKKKIAQNSMHFLQQQQQEKKQQQEKDKQKKSQRDQSDNDQNGSDQNSDQGSGNESSEDQQNSDGNKNDQKKYEGKNNPENKDDKNQDDSKDKESEKLKEKQPLPPKKLPAKLKQLMSDDRRLQMEMIERGTRDMNKRKSNTSKDW